MSDTENEAVNDLLPSAEEQQEYYAYLGKLYEEEGNLTLPLMAFDKEVRCNYEALEREYARNQAILGHHKDVGIRIDAIEKAMDSYISEAAALLGLPSVMHTMYTRKIAKNDDMVRRVICGKDKDKKRKELYWKMVPIKKLIKETINDIWNYLDGCMRIDWYEDSQEMNLDSCLHEVMEPTSSNLMRAGWRGRSVEGGRERYDVFISHAGEDKRTVAMPLQESLSRYGVRCFLDIEDLRPGDQGWASMIHAMKTATVGVVILSPEFAAKRWPIIELDCFLERQSGQGVGCMVVPVFYRLEKEDCGGSLVLEQAELFEKLGFFERVSHEETSEEFVRKTLTEVGKIDGIENEEGAGNWNSEEMKDRREQLIERVVDRVRSALDSCSQDGESEDQIGDDVNGTQNVPEYY